jgi:hypothetical protein
MIELNKTLCDQKWMMVGQACYAGPEHNAPSSVRCNTNKNFRRRNRLPTSRMMLAYPRLIVPKVVKPLDEL